MWIDIACIVFTCVTMNHLGLIKAIEESTETEILILDCPKCSTFWCVLFYSVLTSKQVIAPLAISFLASYLAIWLELLEGFIDTLYMKIYEKIYPDTSDNEASADKHPADTTGTVP